MTTTPSEAADVPELAFVDGRLHWHGIDVAAITANLSTPFFLISEARIAGNIASIRNGFHEAGLDATIRYCAKTNCELAVLEITREAGTDLLVAHIDEGEIALRAGFSPRSLAFQKPVLTSADARWVVSNEIGMVHVASSSDVERLEHAAAEARSVVPVSIRVRDELAPAFTPLGFFTRRLGIASRETVRLARRIAGSEWLELRALNCYIGTHQGGTAKFAKAIDLLCKLVATLANEGIPIHEINLGGGIPSPGTMKRNRGRVAPTSGIGSLRGFAHALGTLCLETMRRHEITPTLKIAVEPGRAIVGDAALVVTRVDGVTGRWLYLDASRNFLGESPLFIRRRTLPLMKPAARERLHFLSGRTLNTLDVIDPFRKLASPLEGDLLAIADAGAYTLGRVTRYAGLTPAVHLLRSSGTLVPIRDAETFEEMLRAMRSISDDDS
ncbi:MAG TPA: alanine racemase [Thermoanaerobaculia bacterium]